MFMGSQHVPTGEFDRLLEAAGADNNGSTTEDRTNYYEDGPANALPLMLWLDSDRMGFLLPEITADKVDLQRGVVQNERRQSYENRPYGLAEENILQRLYPADHPYHWPVIGSMADLSAATLEDVRGFFRTYYTPNNASLAIAGDITPRAARELVERYFGEVPRGPAVARPAPPPVRLGADVYASLEDRVQVPRVYDVWHTMKAFAAQFLSRMERVGGFGGKADQLNFYNYFVGTPDYFQKDLDRYRKVTAADVQDAVRRYLVDAHRVVLSVVPQGKPELAVKQ